MTKYLPALIKNKNHDIWILSRVSTTKSIPGHIIVKLKCLRQRKFKLPENDKL
jgi:hypothetical protein